MADTKISALTAATTPLAGTEVLPIVQSSTTKQVSVANLTAGRAVSADSLTLANALTAANGGTGQSSYAVGDLLYASTTTALSKLADVATGNALISGGVGVAPSWGKIGLTTHISGTLPTANGGTNLTSFTANGVMYASSTSALATSSAFTWDGTTHALTANGSGFKAMTGSDSANYYAGFLANYSYGEVLRFYVKGGSVAESTILSWGEGAGLTINNGGASAPVIIKTANTEVARFFASRGVSIGNTTDPGATNLSVTGSISATDVIKAKATTTNGSTYAFQATNSANTDLMSARSDGLITVGTAANSPYNLTTGNGANVYVDNQGWLYRSTSSIKYKTDIQDAVHGLSELLQLKAVTYKQKSLGPNGEVDEKVYGGLTAEQVHETGLTEFVQYAQDGTPDALHYGNMVSLCVKAIQDQHQIIETLKAQLDALTAK